MPPTVIGLGKRGAQLSAVLAYKGDSLIGGAAHARAVGPINQGKALTFQQRLDELIWQVRERLCPRNDCDVPVANIDLTFILVSHAQRRNRVFLARMYAGRRFCWQSRAPQGWISLSCA
ncbi:MAG: hypothetical protein QXI12_01140 [Candidatus Methanomethyliaceae archaeon]